MPLAAFRGTSGHQSSRQMRVEVQRAHRPLQRARLRPAESLPRLSPCKQDDTYTESYISTIGVDFVSAPYTQHHTRGRLL